jgi:20S proteasome alpha/beta subunit
MRTECLNHRFVYDEPLQIFRLVNAVADSMLLKKRTFNPFVCLTILLYFFCAVSESTAGTMQYGRRPYGVGLLVAGYDVRVLAACTWVC